LRKIEAKIAVNGIYKNGKVHPDRRIQSEKPIKVIVTFLDEEFPEIEKRLAVKDFSFLDSREKSKRFNGSLSDAVIEDRKAER
jgi:hypothetical protein